MNKLTIFACASILLGACNSETTTTTEAEKSDSTKPEQTVITDGWTSLFDGQSTAGWHRYGGGPIAGWKVADGVLYLDTTALPKDNRSNDLVSDEEYGNFDLKLEWKIAKNGNSGIIFYSHEDTAAYHNTYETGPEMQVVDNDGHPDGKLVKHQAGDLYDLIASSTKNAKPAGEWNQVEIKSVDGKLELSQNGEVVVSTTMWDDNWKKMVAGSKFKTMSGFGTYKTGHICLQDHGNMVSFRNIQVKKL